MDFAGDFTFVAANEDNDEDMMEVDYNVAAPQPNSPVSFNAAPVMKKQKVKKANTNVLAVDLSTLSSDAELKAGEPAFCSNCNAVFSLLSTVQPNGYWVCEFCNQSNLSHLEDAEKPTTETCDWITEPAPKHTSTSTSSEVVIFVVDISGSMCCSQEVPGTFKLRSGNNNSAPALEPGDDRYQHLPQSKSKVTYVSRIQCVQAAVEAQLDQMFHQTPSALVGLVTFNNDVTIYGDGFGTPVVISGDKLNNYDQLISIGKSHKITRPISESKDKLVNQVRSISENGPTALGPAVAVSLGMTNGCTSGSRIVLATDGLSNTGIGAMDLPELIQGATEYYESLAATAQAQSTSINIVSIRGGDSVKMAILGKLSDATQGEVNIVDPIKMISEFSSMLQNKLVATNVSVKLILQKGLSVVNIDTIGLVAPSASSSSGSAEEPKKQEQVGAGLAPQIATAQTEQVVGNAYDDSELTFEYKVNNANELDQLLEERARLIGAGATADKKLPFQVQIRYTKLDGTKCVRTITRQQEITKERAKAEKHLKPAILSAHAWQQSAKLAEQGHYEAAMVNNLNTDALFSRAQISNESRQQYSAKASQFNAHMASGMARQAAHYPSSANSAPAPYGAPVSAPQQQQLAVLNDDDEAISVVKQFKSTRKAKKF